MFYLLDQENREFQHTSGEFLPHPLGANTPTAQILSLEKYILFL